MMCRGVDGLAKSKHCEGTKNCVDCLDYRRAQKPIWALKKMTSSHMERGTYFFGS